MLSDGQLLRSLGLRARVAIKRELQRLMADHDACASFLCTAAANGDKSAGVESVGEQNALPRWSSLGGSVSSICDQRILRSNDREDRPVVLLYSRLCIGAPTLVLGLVDPGTPFADALTEDVENAIIRIESIVVDVLDPAEGSSRTTRQQSKARLTD